MSARIIEYFGLPGSGKTTALMCYREQPDAYYSNGRRIGAEGESFSKWKFLLRGCLSLSFLKRLPAFFRLVFRYGLYKKNVFCYMKEALRLLCCEIALDREKPDITVVSDMGFIQLAVSVMKRKRVDPERFAEDYVRFFLLPELYCRFEYLDVPPEECCRRIYRRGKRLSIMTGSESETLDRLVGEKALFAFWAERLEALSAGQNHISFTRHCD